MKRFMEIIIANVVNQSFNSETNELDYEALSEALRSVYPASITPQQIMDAAGGERVVSAEDFIFEYTEDIKAEYERLEERLNQNPLALAQLGKEPMRVLERRVVLATVDRLWREHLYEMDYLKEGIGLRAMGQRDPLVEYGEEGAQMFSAMMENIREDSVTQAFSFAGQFELAYQQQQEAALQAAKEEAVKKNLAAPNAADIMGDTGKEHLGKLTTSGPAETAEEPRGNRQERRKKK